MVDQDYFLHMLAYGFWFAILIIRVCAIDRPVDDAAASRSAPRRSCPIAARATDTPSPIRPLQLAGRRHPVSHTQD